MSLSLDAISTRAADIRDRYHALERRLHGTAWSTGEDALAFLTDAALVGRLTMAAAARWPTSASTTSRSIDDGELAAKLAECVWWLAVLAQRQGIDLGVAVDTFLTDKERSLP